jgi:hypothetical protein
MNSREKPSAEMVEACMARVLQSEREAQASIEAASGRAAAAVALARERSRAIAAHAETRLAAARQSVEARIARRQAEIDRQGRGLRENVVAAEAGSARLDRALAAVAASLTTGEKP